MSQRLGRALLHGFSFIGISIPIIALVITTLTYFEILSVATTGKLLYISFVVIFFVGTTIVSKHMAEKGWLIGFCMALILIVLNLVYLTIGIEASLNFKFLVRSCIILVICLAGGMIGVNLPGAKQH